MPTTTFIYTPTQKEATVVENLEVKGPNSQIVIQDENFDSTAGTITNTYQSLGSLKFNGRYAFSTDIRTGAEIEAINARRWFSAERTPCDLLFRVGTYGISGVPNIPYESTRETTDRTLNEAPLAIRSSRLNNIYTAPFRLAYSFLQLDGVTELDTRAVNVNGVLGNYPKIPGLSKVDFNNGDTVEQVVEGYVPSTNFYWDYDPLIDPRQNIYQSPQIVVVGSTSNVTTIFLPCINEGGSIPEHSYSRLDSEEFGLNESVFFKIINNTSSTIDVIEPIGGNLIPGNYDSITSNPVNYNSTTLHSGNYIEYMIYDRSNATNNSVFIITAHGSLP